MSATRRQIGRCLIAAGCSLAIVAVAGCSSSAPGVTAHDVMLEREQALEAESRSEFEAFLDEHGDRLDEVGLPRPTFDGVIPAERWGEAVIDCVESLDADVRVSRQEGGFGVNYFGVPDETYDRIRWTIESCMAQHGLAAPVTPLAGPVEAAWLRLDASQRLLPCWRSLGLSAPPLPNSASALRVEALCPPSDVELQRQLDLVVGER